VFSLKRAYRSTFSIFRENIYRSTPAGTRTTAFVGRSAPCHNSVSIGYSVLGPDWMLGEPAVRINKRNASAWTCAIEISSSNLPNR
jgi:hypothetical protein